MKLPMSDLIASDLISVTPANVETVLSDLPRLVRLASGLPQLARLIGDRPA